MEKIILSIIGAIVSMFIGVYLFGRSEWSRFWAVVMGICLGLAIFFTILILFPK